MRHVKKPVFFIVAALIAVFTALTFIGFSTQYGDIKTTHIKGGNDIRWGIDIRGGVDVTFAPPEGYDATEAEMDAAKAVISQRLVSLAITDSDLFVDYKNDRIIVRFPWKSDEENFDPEEAVKELGETALLTFREGYEIDEAGVFTGVTASTIILEGKDVKKAEALYNQEKKEYLVSLDFHDSGKTAFADATGRLVGQTISIWMDDVCISNANVKEKIADGNATITGNFTAQEVKELADKINAGALPFKLETSSLNVISPTLGTGAKNAMVLSGAIAFLLVAMFIVAIYRLPGFVAAIALIGQVAGSVAAVSGFFGSIPSFTLTIPGIAGIILSIGMGVDANIITAERIKEELNKGKTLDGSISLGYQRAFTAIFDGNVTVIIVAMVLMGAFGTPDSFFAKAFNTIFFMFGPSTEGAIYSFGYTLLAGVIMNFIFGITASRLMLMSISKFKIFRNKKLYGGVENEQ